MSSRNVELSSEAFDDLLHVLQYSDATWGTSVMIDYGRKIAEGIERVASFPSIGKVVRESSPQIRSFQVGSHDLLYMETPSGLVIIRIIHQRRSWETPEQT